MAHYSIANLYPSFWGHHESDNRLGLGLMGSIRNETDFGDSAVMVFSSRTYTGNLNYGQVVNRPLFEWWNLGEPKMTMSADGKLGIGTTTPSGMMDIKSPAINGATSGKEVLFRGQVNDAPQDFFEVVNHTLFDNQFIPFLWGHLESDNRLALYMMGNISNEMDYGDNAFIVFSSRTYASYLQYGQIAERPLFEWRNFAEPKMTMST